MSRQPKTKLSLNNLEDRLTPAGWLDPNFGIGGIAATGPLGSVIAAQSNGKILSSVTNADFHPGLVRLNADGSRDTSFGDNGFALLRSTSYASVLDIEVAPSGEIYVLDYVDYNSAPEQSVRSVVYRLTPDGQLDGTFDGDGKVDNATVVNGLTLLSDGRLALMSRYRGWYQSITTIDFLLPDGSRSYSSVETAMPNAAFDGTLNGGIREIYATGDGGMTVVAFGVFTDEQGAVRSGPVVSRWDSQGRLDTTYGTNGYAAVDIGMELQGNAALTPLGVDDLGGVILSYGIDPNRWGGGNEPTLHAVVRLTNTGQLDAGFAGDGIAEISVPRSGVTRFITIGTGLETELPIDGMIRSGQVLSDGRIVLLVRGDDTVQLRVLNSDGSPDATVADGGWLSLESPSLSNGLVGNEENFTYVLGGVPSAMLPDGRIAFLGLTDPRSTAAVVVDLNAATPDGGIYDGAMSTGFNGNSGRLIPVPLAPQVEPPIAEPTPPTLPEPVPPEAPIPPYNGDGRSSIPPPSLVGPDIGDTRLVIPVPGDFNRDGVADDIVVNGSRVSVTSGKDGSVIIPEFSPYEDAYTGGLNAVALDIDGDGISELVVAPSAGGGAVVAVYDANGTQRNRFFGLDDRDFRGGLGLAAGKVNSDGTRDLVVTAGVGGGPRVAVYDGSTIGTEVKKLMADFFAFEAEQRGGVTALFREGILVFGAGFGGGPRVRGVDAAMLSDATQSGQLQTLGSPRMREFDRFIGDPSLRNGAKLDFELGENLAYTADGTFFGVQVDDGEGEPAYLAGKWGRFYVPGLDPVPELPGYVTID
jgi:uncharacterized delta-60 repeat protein